MEQTPALADEQDRATVSRYLEGQRDAAGDLVDRYQKRVFNLALRMLDNVQDAEDVTQNVFLNAFLKLRTYNPKYRFFSWIYRMAVNESLNALKRRRRTVTLDDALGVQAPDPPADRTAEAREYVGKALMRLTPDDRAVVVLRHFVSFSYQEIADVLEIPIGTVMSRLSRGRKQLYENLIRPKAEG